MRLAKEDSVPAIAAKSVQSKLYFSAVAISTDSRPTIGELYFVSTARICSARRSCSVARMVVVPEMKRRMVLASQTMIFLIVCGYYHKLWVCQMCFSLEGYQSPVWSAS